jgi:hypothetical protein
MVVEIEHYTCADEFGDGHPTAPGGPDFSCFLLTKEGHAHYRFDERFIPAYHEDLDTHRRYMLGGHGDKIFGINLPFLHYASQTMNQAAPAAQAKFRQGFEGSKAYYLAKWGGPVNQETFRTPFGKGVVELPYTKDKLVTTPELQTYWQAKMRGEPPTQASSWTEADRQRALSQPEDLDE